MAAMVRERPYSCQLDRRYPQTNVLTCLNFWPSFFALLGEKRLPMSLCATQETPEDRHFMAGGFPDILLESLSG
jgi:hypothetical protein